MRRRRSGGRRPSPRRARLPRHSQRAGSRARAARQRAQPAPGRPQEAGRPPRGTSPPRRRRPPRRSRRIAARGAVLDQRPRRRMRRGLQRRSAPRRRRRSRSRCSRGSGRAGAGRTSSRRATPSRTRRTRPPKPRRSLALPQHRPGYPHTLLSLPLPPHRRRRTAAAAAPARDAAPTRPSRAHTGAAGDRRVGAVVEARRLPQGPRRRDPGPRCDTLGPDRPPGEDPRGPERTREDPGGPGSRSGSTSRRLPRRTASTRRAVSSGTGSPS